MSERLYYNDPSLTSFDATVAELTSLQERRVAVVLDRTAFYPTSGGQPFDTGVLRAEGAEFRVVDVVDREADGAIVHIVESATRTQELLRPGVAAHGEIDVERRRDHMQQHSGQHVLSAAFVRLFDMPTVSFHLGDESCSIDVAAESLTGDQLRRAEELANYVVTDDRPVEIRYASVEQAREMGLRKLPPRSGEIRLIDIHDFDLTACGGTHVHRTGQIGVILLRKREKVKQGTRVEFLCGARAVRASRADYETLTEAAELFSGHPRELAALVRKSNDELKSAGKMQQKLLEQIAEYEARELLGAAEQQPSIRLVLKTYSDRDSNYAKLMARKLSAAPGVVAVIASAAPQPTVVMACAPDVELDCGAILKAAMAAAGGRGGGTPQMAQGGVAHPANLAAAMARIRESL